VVDKAVFAAKIAAIRDAVARVRAKTAADVRQFAADRLHEAARGSIDDLDAFCAEVARRLDG
jgi:hypothetical protein